MQQRAGKGRGEKRRGAERRRGDEESPPWRTVPLATPLGRVCSHQPFGQPRPAPLHSVERFKCSDRL